MPHFNLLTTFFDSVQLEGDGFNSGQNDRILYGSTNVCETIHKFIACKLKLKKRT